MSGKNILKLVQTAILLAIIILMSLTPLGYLKIGLLSISLLTIPVVIGAMIIGPLGGLVLGTAFGVTSFLQCFGADAFGTMLFSINPFFTFLMCVPTRALMGYLTGIIFKAIRKRDKTKTVSFFIAGLVGAVLNTVLFMGTLCACFWNTEYIQEINAGVGGKGVLLFIVSMVGLNGIVEMLCTSSVGGGIAKGVSLVIKRTSDGEYI